jgi:arylsulfatase A-like enzyme
MEIDWSVGQVLAHLKKLGLDERTLVIFTSDNGPWLAYGVDGGSAGLLRDGKGTTWEGGMRVPAIARWPGKIPANRRTDAIAANFDLLPTFARLAGAALPGDRTLDGRDLWPVLSGETTDSPHPYFHYLGAGVQQAVNYHGIRNARWKLTVTVGADDQLIGQQLYDLGEDPSERFDRIKAQPEIARRLRAAAQEFYTELKANVRPAGRRAGL